MKNDLIKLTTIIFTFCIEAWARLFREIPMPIYLGTWVALFESLYEGLERYLLRRCPCVFWRHSVYGNTADVTNANALFVVPLTVGSFLAFGSAFPDLAVQRNEVVVADCHHARIFMPARDIVYRHPAPFGRSGAMHYDFTDFSHF